MRFRPLSRDPFTDIRRRIPEFRSVGLAESKEVHSFSVDKKNVFEIDGEAARFLFQYAPKYVDMFSCNPAAYEQHHEIFSANDSIDSAAHFALSVNTFHSLYRSGLQTYWSWQTRLPSLALNAGLTLQQPHWFSKSPKCLFHGRMLGTEIRHYA